MSDLSVKEIVLRREAADEIIRLMERVAPYYETAEELYQWFTSPQPLIRNMTPAALVARGETQKMIDVWDSIDAGNYI